MSSSKNVSGVVVKPVINGIEVKVGQVWADMANNRVTILDIISSDRYPLKTNGSSYTLTGHIYNYDDPSDCDLVTLIKDVEPTVPTVENAVQQLTQEFGKLNDNLDAVYNAREAYVSNQDKKHSHYFKDVSHIDTIDIYRVLQLYNVTKPMQTPNTAEYSLGDRAPLS